MIADNFLKTTLPFWDKLNDEEQASLLRSYSPVHYTKGTNVSSPTRTCLGVLLVQKGRLRVYLLSEDGREITLFRLNAGDVCILSAACLLESITFDVHIDAETESDCLLIHADAYARLQANNIYVENYSLNLTAQKFSEVMWAMQQMLFRRFDQRLADFLNAEVNKTGSPVLHLTHEEIARQLNTAREVVSRMLKRFEADGLVELNRGVVVVRRQMTEDRSQKTDNR